MSDLKLQKTFTDISTKIIYIDNIHTFYLNNIHLKYEVKWLNEKPLGTFTLLPF